MSLKNDKSKSQIPFESYEEVFVYLKNQKSYLSNKKHTGDPDRVEHDFNEVEKEHLNLLRAKLNLEIANEALRSSEKMGEKLWWLRVALFFLSAASVIAAVFELCQ